MFVSQTADYALRAVVFLADCDGQPQTTQQIAAVTRVPSGYLAKVLQALAKAGLLVAQRGLHGGFALAKKPQNITVFDVVDVVDVVAPFQRIGS